LHKTVASTPDWDTGGCVRDRELQFFVILYLQKVSGSTA
jgi:hypothetical protein